MPDLDALKKKIAGKEEYSALKEKALARESGLTSEIDMEKVDKIVKRMREKYRAEGVEFEEVGGTLRELRGMIAEGSTAKIEIQTIEELREVKSKMIKALAGVYIRLGGFTKFIANALSKLPETEMLAFYLYSANMHYSSKQYLALTVAASTIVLLCSLLVTAALLMLTTMALPLRILLCILAPIICFIATAVIMLMVPKQRAIARGYAVSIELPFALRHMATELRAGIGLYRTIQAVATAGYGALSEEFSQVITEVEEGTDTQDALRHLALRTQSRALRNALIHIIRALKTGGNLSENMNEIAADVSFDLRMAIKEFGMKANFFGVIFIFGAIVLPVMISILGGIRNSPIQAAAPTMQMLPLTVPVIAAIYLIVMPIVLLIFIFYLKSAQPRV
ncbi:MAG: type II secretion system F family protein [Candidatus Diapherotrites archaeon]|nr:type II secretion system F family protein [Candidatus Diapherotrites archaeon]